MVRFGRRRALPYAAAMGAVSTARNAYYFGKRAARKWYNKYKKWRRSPRKRRMNRRTKVKFLRSVGMSQNRVVTCVHRGCTALPVTSNTALQTLCFWQLNNPRLCTKNDANLGAAWAKTATGFNHMMGLYAKWRCLGSVAYITLRPQRVKNVAAVTGGTSTNTYYNAGGIKVGLTKGPNESASGLFTEWTQAALRPDQIKTLHPTFAKEPPDGVHFVVRFAPPKDLGIQYSAYSSDYNSYCSKSENPSQIVNAFLWLQAADIATALVTTNYEVSWVIKFKTAFYDMNFIEDDMYQGTVPS